MHRVKKASRPPLWVSQNYLTSAGIIRNLINRTSLDKCDHVIEIGPGKGHITRLLAERCGKVTAVELDGMLYCKLKERFDGIPNLVLRHHDFLRWNLPANGKYKVFSNIPFHITTDIIRKLTECGNPPEEIWLVMEKGAAKRFTGKPCETVNSLLLKPLFELDIAYYFRREDFHPKPGVDAVLLHLKKKRHPDIPVSQWAEYKRFVSIFFKYGAAGMRRYLGSGCLAKACRAAGLQRDFTPGNILYVQWLCLFRCRHGNRAINNFYGERD